MVAAEVCFGKEFVVLSGKRLLLFLRLYGDRRVIHKEGQVIECIPVRRILPTDSVSDIIEGENFREVYVPANLRVSLFEDFEQHQFYNC